MNPTPQDPDTRDEDLPTLSPADALALDAMLEGSFDLSTDLSTDLSPDISLDPVRQAAVRRVLALLDRWPVEALPAGLTDRVMQRLTALAQASQHRITTLSPDDARALEAVLATRSVGAAQGPVPAGLGERARAVRGVLGLLDDWQVLDPAADLIDKTLEGVHQDRQRHELGRQIHMLDRESRSWAAGIRRIGSIAAVMLIGMSLLLPALSKTHQDAQVIACRSNLGQAGRGLVSYAHDNRGLMPRATTPDFDHLARFADASVETPGDALPSSKVHMLLLSKYLDPQMLACPSADDKHFGGLYSVQNPAGTRAVRLPETQGQPVMADTNPLYRIVKASGRLVRDPARDVMSVSLNHRGEGQNVMISDGSVVWMIRPVVEDQGEKDNIWVLQAQRASMKQGPTNDAFLTP